MQVSVDSPAVSFVPAPSIAGPLVRLLSVLYDFLLIASLVLVSQVVLTVLGTFLFHLPDGKPVLVPLWYSYGIMFPVALFIIWSFYAVFWARAGQTLGMQTWNLKLVTADGKLPRYGVGYFRCAMASLLPLILALIAYLLSHSSAMFATSFIAGFILNHLFAYTNPRHMALQDLLSGTVVLRMPAPRLRLLARARARLKGQSAKKR